MRVLQSTIEKALYLILLLVFVCLAVMTVVLVNIGNKVNQQQVEIKSGVSNIQTQVSCISDFFLQPNRTDITLGNLAPCNKVKK